MRPVLDLDALPGAAGDLAAAARFRDDALEPMLQAARGRSGPISPASNGAAKMPSARPRTAASLGAGVAMVEAEIME